MAVRKQGLYAGRLSAEERKLLRRAFTLQEEIDLLRAANLRISSMLEGRPFFDKEACTLLGLLVRNCSTIGELTARMEKVAGKALDTDQAFIAAVQKASQPFLDGFEPQP